ncbi:hypothetical protein PanWU01x14_327340 [Parasponia andersonii]|uniref:Uncharacterized protein n=1 Tax=Parasponia andersonii TaxID=3476 RepID=A0A2P5AJ30_PARAD|nr:hypothetical protein PanWU01x14_327340 [Parasponia andersonii]
MSHLHGSTSAWSHKHGRTSTADGSSSKPAQLSTSMTQGSMRREILIISFLITFKIMMALNTKICADLKGIMVLHIPKPMKMDELIKDTWSLPMKFISSLYEEFRSLVKFKVGNGKRIRLSLAQNNTNSEVKVIQSDFTFPHCRWNLRFLRNCNEREFMSYVALSSMLDQKKWDTERAWLEVSVHRSRICLREIKAGVAPNSSPKLSN